MSRLKSFNTPNIISDNITINRPRSVSPGPRTHRSSISSSRVISRVVDALLDLPFTSNNQIMDYNTSIGNIMDYNNVGNTESCDCVKHHHTRHMSLFKTNTSSRRTHIKITRPSPSKVLVSFHPSAPGSPIAKNKYIVDTVSKKYSLQILGDLPKNLEPKYNQSIIIPDPPPNSTNYNYNEIRKRMRRLCYNSMNTMYIDQTLAVPDNISMLKAAGFLISSKIKELSTLRLPEFETDFVGRGLNPIYFLKIPTSEQVYSFLQTVFHNAQLFSECNVIALAYVDRLMIKTGITLTTSNWYSIVLGAYCLASKIWDDLSMANCDFSKVCPVFTLQDINNFEIAYLNYFDYDIEIKSSKYAEIYFLLRDIFIRNIDGGPRPIINLAASKVGKEKLSPSPDKRHTLR